MLILNPSCATKALIQNAAQHVSSSTSQNEPLLLCSSLCTGYLSHEGQGIDACLQIYRLSSPLLSFAPSPRPHQKPTISQWATARGTITESQKRISLQNILIYGSWWYSPSPEMQNLWQHSKDNWKLISSAQHLTSYKNKKINKNLSFSLSPPNAFHGLFLALYDDSI